MDESIRFAKKYLEDILSFFGLNADVLSTHEDEIIKLDIPSSHLNGFLIGSRSETLRALQSLVSAALSNQGYDHSRVNIDVAGYKRQRADRLARQAEVWIKEVKDQQVEKSLEPMNAADRRIIHKLATEYGLITESVGQGLERHVVLRPNHD